MKKQEEMNNELRSLYNNKDLLKKFEVVFKKYEVLVNDKINFDTDYKNGMTDLFLDLKENYAISKKSFLEIYNYNKKQEEEKELELDNKELLNKITKEIE